MSDESDLIDGIDDEGNTKKKGSVLALIPVLLIGLGGGAFLGMNTLSETVGQILTDRALNPAAADDGHGGGGGHGDDGHGGPAAPVSETAMVENLVVNPARSGGSRFLLISIAIKVMDPDQVEYVDAAQVELRAKLLRVLGARTTEELSNIENRDAIAWEIRNTIEEVLGPNVVRDVFIPQFVIQ